MLSWLWDTFLPILHPIGMVWFLLVLEAASLARRRRWQGAIYLGVLIVIIWVIGATPVPARLLASLERPYARSAQGEIPTCDAVFMLGGTLTASPYDLLGFDLGDTVDRVVTSLELMRQNNGGAMVISGGGTQQSEHPWSETQLLQHWFKAWGIPAAPVVDLGVCASTHDEALRAAKLCKERGWKKVIIVTSAFHMRRAEAAFRTIGVPIVCVACDFRGLNQIDSGQWYSLFPQLRGFEDLEIYVHEETGWFYYRWHGWLGK